jgi:regulator of nucleoside diphosphate kinase
VKSHASALMKKEIQEVMSQHIILTTGLYDLIKDHVRRKKVTPREEVVLTGELKKASQVLRRDLPEDVVSVNRKVTYRDHSNNEEKTVLFVGPKKAKRGKNKVSILSDEGIAMVGYKVGDLIEWPSGKGDLKLEILHVEEAV